MKKTQLKDFFREIRKSLNRYLSIFFIVALGVAFFAGVRSTEPDMRLTVDSYLDDMDFMDVRVVSTMGLTDEDIEALKKVDGVTSVQGSFEADMFTNIEGEQKTIHVMSITSDINKACITEGRMPENPGECLADMILAKDYGYKVGDTITVTASGDDEQLLKDTFTISGFAMSPFYLTFQRGNTAIGDGRITAFIMTDSENFTQDYYNQAYIRSDALQELSSYDDEYEEELKAFEDRIESISGTRCQERYDEVYGEAESRLASGEAEYEDARKEAEEELGKAEIEIESASEEIENGYDRLNEARLELSEAQKELEDGRQKLEDGRQEISLREQELLEKEQEIITGREELNNSYNKLTASQQEYDTGMEAISQAKLQYEEGLEQYSAYSAELEKAKLSLDETAAKLKAGWEAYDKGYGDYDALCAAQAEYDEALKQYNAGIEELKASKDKLDIVQKEISDKEALLESAGAELENGWQQYGTAKEQLDAADIAISEGKVQIKEAKEQLGAKEAELSTGGKEIEEAKQQIADSEQELDEAKAELDDTKKEYLQASLDAEQELNEARESLDEGWKELKEMEMPEWYILDRSTIQTYVEYGTDAERIGAIGKVFPVIFFLVAALVCLTTMTRMVEEQRTQIGTFKALGYSTFSIALKYMLYALTASVGGSIIGAVIGVKLFPAVIINAYGMLYDNIPYVCTPFNAKYSVMAAIGAVSCTTIAAVAACYKALYSQAAQLMRPSAPKQGKKIFIERITPIWKRLNFSQKATLRNLFRYKKRLFMTIFGIGTCTALLIVGFGLRDAISAIVGNQFERVWLYEAAVMMDTDAEEALDELEIMISENEHIERSMEAYIGSMDAQKGSEIRSVYLFVPERLDEFENFVSLHDRKTGEKYELGDDEVIISEKLSTLLELKEGDSFALKKDDTSFYEVKVGAVAESYLQHYVYMSPALYKNVFGDVPVYNQMVLNISEDEAQKDEIAEALLANEAVSSVSFTEDTADVMDRMMSSLDSVIWVLIISAGLLAFVVLYNLNNISITERIRELATLKVLGFYNGEVALYVYRENILLTVIGMAVGLIMGKYLQKFVITTAEIDIIMFGRDISFESYMLSIIITVVFAVIVNAFMYFRLKKIDMIESLKSVE